MLVNKFYVNYINFKIGIGLKCTNLGTLLNRNDTFKVGVRGGAFVFLINSISPHRLNLLLLLSVGGHVPLNYGQTGPCPPGYSNPHPGIYPTQQNGEFEPQADSRVPETGYNLVCFTESDRWNKYLKNSQPKQRILVRTVMY